MTTAKLRPGERLDGLPAQNIQIIQNPDMFAYSLDAILLAHFAQPKKKGRGLSLDLGAGTGAIGLFYAPKVLGPVKLVEIQPELADMAARSVALNDLSDRVSVLNTDMKSVFDEVNPGSVDTVLANPPYFPTNEKTKQNLDRHYQLARHEVAIDLPGLVQVANKLLKNHGKFYLVHRPERLTEIMAALATKNFAISRLQFVYGKADRPANMVLLEAIKDGGSGGTRVLPPLVAYTNQNDYTPQLREILYGPAWTLSDQR